MLEQLKSEQCGRFVCVQGAVVSWLSTRVGTISLHSRAAFARVVKTQGEIYL